MDLDQESMDNSTDNSTIFVLAKEDVYIFDNIYVRIFFISIYTIVFCLCFFGNFLVIMVVTLSRRLRSITNFFLANLAVADFCVGIFCVYQNLLNYLITDWILGDFLCKMYHFITSLSYTASIFILVVICTERYFAIIYPITCKQILTPRRLRLVILAVWINSALYSAPKFFWFNTVSNYMDNGRTEIFCAPNRSKYNSELFDIINFVFLYVNPLLIMTVLYTKIAVRLWKSSRQLEKQLNANANSTNQTLCRRQSSRYKNHVDGNKMLQNPLLSNPSSSQNVLRARRGVIRMLIIVVLTFALCNLPLHARKMWQYWSNSYQGDDTFSTLLTPLTFLVTYFNSGVNPLLYAFLSRNFRRGMREILLCSHHGRRQPSHRNQNMIGLQGGIQRHASTRSTIKNNATTVTILHNEPSSECSHEL
ncbi:PREDICTED: galanin receptor type 2-like isoform X2 [Nicrophorus vespilloides]|uniref:Galanin receptor type 2-like isoform X2 n=1 Tax=Nicrophorus vespilloides TaxID=110193 RepID=A0ABM1M9D2_NICVS|nr:PREDICTED: galanin receptor type 2-like isoform X2 [Nicrophorus vespilloides]